MNSTGNSDGDVSIKIGARMPQKWDSWFENVPFQFGVDLYFSPFFTCVPMLCPSKMCFPWDFQGVPHRPSGFEICQATNPLGKKKTVNS